jgi:hypothetical protein
VHVHRATAFSQNLGSWNASVSTNMRPSKLAKVHCQRSHFQPLNCLMDWASREAELLHQNEQLDSKKERALQSAHAAVICAGEASSRPVSMAETSASAQTHRPTTAELAR